MFANNNISYAKIELDIPHKVTLKVNVKGTKKLPIKTDEESFVLVGTGLFGLRLMSSALPRLLVALADLRGGAFLSAQSSNQTLLNDIHLILNLRGYFSSI